ncbi:MAG: hypothetical protein JXA99_06385 [Candidatus Lokiarchaeota archaeon]|nr:hypothetical protein [Candidatus Lokiarchaeota archaeon]
MNSDKIPKLLERYLKIIGKKTRLDILKSLSNKDNALTFSDIQKEIFNLENGNINLSFHLNALKKLELIETSQSGYSISNLGKDILKKILEIEQTLNHFNKCLLIRTSKYITEPFDSKKINNFLIKEAGMESFLAKKISNLVQNKLSKTKIKYLTSPLLREYINGILLEEGLEEFRHKLTRLGVPPYDTNIFFQNNSLDPELFIKRMGSEVSEQFLLLNLLPNNLADLYLSKKIILKFLDYWALRPLSVFIQLKTLFKYLTDNNNSVYNFENFFEDNLYMKFNTKLQHILNLISPFFSDNIFLFNNEDLNENIYNDGKKIDIFFSSLVSQINIFNQFNNFPKINIGISYNYSSIVQIIKKLLSFDYLLETNPLIFYLDHSELYNTNIFTEITRNPLILKHINKIVFQIVQKKSNSLILPNPNIENAQNSNRIVLDKILINLNQIAQEAKTNDNIFFEILEDRLNSTFSLFEFKEDLIQKKIGNSKTWRIIIENLIQNDLSNWIKKTIKSISFIGLNDAVLNHCGLEIDKIEQSESFACSILEFMKKKIIEKNNFDNNMYCLSQPSIEFGSSDYDLIRQDSNLPLENKIILFKKISQFIDDGAVFNVNLKPDEEDQIIPVSKIIIDSNINRFKFNLK